MTIEERLDRLTGIVETLAVTVVAHDNQIEARDKQIEAHDKQIEALLKIAENHAASIRELVDGTLELRRQWQAYINRQPRQ